LFELTAIDKCKDLTDVLKFIQYMGIILKPLDFRFPHRKKSRVLKTGDLAGHNPRTCQSALKYHV
jgi:hypothetical protein